MLAFALMFWCAGTGCMMVSYARAAATDANAGSGALDHAMAGSMSMDAHACCKAKRSTKKVTAAHGQSKDPSSDLNLLATPSLPAPTGVMNCCPLTSGSILVNSPSQSHDNATLLRPATLSFSSLSAEFAPLAIPDRLPNRAQSYLLDCAFLI